VVGETDAASHHGATGELWPVVLDALADLRSRFDVVVCEGAGGAAEINLLDGDLANLPLAAAAGLPALLVADIERGGVFASLYGTVALLPPELAVLVRGSSSTASGATRPVGRRLRPARAAAASPPSGSSR
jgi:adenosylcobyric acid synthase